MFFTPDWYYVADDDYSLIRRNNSESSSNITPKWWLPCWNSMTILPFTPEEYSFTKTKHSMYCLIIYLDLVNLYGKCRCLYIRIYIYHTWSFWDNQMLTAWFLRDQAENVKKPQGINAIDQLLQVEVEFRGRRISVESVESRGLKRAADRVTCWFWIHRCFLNLKSFTRSNHDV